MSNRGKIKIHSMTNVKSLPPKMLYGKHIIDEVGDLECLVQ